MSKKRCSWAGTDPLYLAYHDHEWGVPVHDDRKLFEFLVLETAQAGLSWITVLRKRDNYRKAFDNFNPDAVARYREKEVASLLSNKGIIRNRKKIESAINNAGCFLRIQDEFGSFDRYVWQFVEGCPRESNYTDLSQIPAQTVESQQMSKDFKGRGFSFVGPVICYAFMQAVGMVNDHVAGCYRYDEIRMMTRNG
jgi:DNA-3-methyladenine glycosylase I